MATKLSRRGFVGRIVRAGALSALIPAAQGALGHLTAAGAATAPAGRSQRQAPTRRWGMVIDLDRCDGCRQCIGACKAEHFVPPGQEWIKVTPLDEAIATGSATGAAGSGGEHFLPQPCQHCGRPPCVKVCPVGASYRTAEGVVLVDHDRCIGCRFCMAACPYGARSFNWSEPPRPEAARFVRYSPEFPVPHRKGTVEKCMFCAHRAKDGRLPACVEACTRSGMKAIFFGDLNEGVLTNGEETIRLDDLMHGHRAFRLREELGTDPSIYYLPARRPAEPATGRKG